MEPRNVPISGHLWRWNNEAGLVAFASGELHCKNKVICIGGLTDGLLPCPYTPPLVNMFCSKNWSVVQPLMTSSYTGYGTGTLERDSAEISQFILHLSEKWGCERVIIIGHSTGCQNAVHFAKYGYPDAVARLVGIVLQAPVSDQESGLLEPHIGEYVQWAKNQASSQLDSLMPIEAHYTPITLRRYISLFDKFGDDDFFSSYMTHAEMSERLHHLHDLSNLKAILVAYSMKDQYVPPAIDKDGLVERIVYSIGPKAIALKLVEGDHNLLNPADGSAQREFVEAVRAMLATRIETE